MFLQHAVLRLPMGGMSKRGQAPPVLRTSIRSTRRQINPPKSVRGTVRRHGGNKQITMHLIIFKRCRYSCRLQQDQAASLHTQEMWMRFYWQLASKSQVPQRIIKNNMASELREGTLTELLSKRREACAGSASRKA